MTGNAKTRHVRKPGLRTVMSVAGISLCVLLMLFLRGAYQGVADGSMDFIYQNRSDLWVLQGNATNILRCTSILPYSKAAELGKIDGVESVSPLLLLLVSVGPGERPATVYLAGYDPGTGKGGPPRLIEGRSVESSHEIVLDRAFAVKYGYAVGDTAVLQGCSLDVVGISDGTNAFVIQYAFVTLERAWLLAGYSGIVTALLLDLDRRRGLGMVEAEVRRLLPNARTFSHQAFVDNNIAEMQAGFLPFVYTISALGAVVLTAVLSLLLSLSITERRRDYAVLKTMGSPSAYLWAVVVRQAIGLVGTGAIIAAGAFPLLIELLAQLAPEVAVRLTLGQLLQVGGIAVLVGLASALIALARLRKIYVMEAFQ